MSGLTRSQRWAWGGGLTVVLAVTVPLWLEFRQPGNLAWNMILGVILLGVAVAALVLQGFLRAHAGEIGEARFDTRNKSNG